MVKWRLQLWNQDWFPLGDVISMTIDCRNRPVDPRKLEVARRPSAGPHRGRDVIREGHS